jgi:hypothetical protein
MSAKPNVIIHGTFAAFEADFGLSRLAQPSRDDSSLGRRNEDAHDILNQPKLHEARTMRFSNIPAHLAVDDGA